MVNAKKSTPRYHKYNICNRRLGKNQKTHTTGTTRDISKKRKKPEKPNTGMGTKSKTMEHTNRMGANATTHNGTR